MAGKMARHPKLTTKSGMPSGITTRMARSRRHGMSVRSTNHAASVPTMALRMVTTTTSETVFQISVAVRLRNRSWCSSAQPTCTAWTTRNTSGSSTATDTRTAPAVRRGGNRRRPPRRLRWSRRHTAPPRHSSWASCSSLIASAPVPELGDGDAVRLQLVERRLGLRGRHTRGDRVLEAVAVGDDLLALPSTSGRPRSAAPRPGGSTTSGSRHRTRRSRTRGRCGAK